MTQRSNAARREALRQTGHRAVRHASARPVGQDEACADGGGLDPQTRDGRAIVERDRDISVLAQASAPISDVEPQIVSTLGNKRDEIEKAIAGYEKALSQAWLDLAHVNATLTIFERVNDTRDVKAYMDTGRLFPRGEIVKLCRAALEAEGPLDTRQLAVRVAAATGLDASDPMLRKALAYRIVQAMTLAWRRGKVGSEGKVAGLGCGFWRQWAALILERISWA